MTKEKKDKLLEYDEGWIQKRLSEIILRLDALERAVEMLMINNMAYSLKQAELDKKMDFVMNWSQYIEVVPGKSSIRVSIKDLWNAKTKKERARIFESGVGEESLKK